MADQNKKLNQKEMLNMIRHGASKIFAGEGKDSLNVDLDIDEVLKAGEKKTEQLTAEYDSKIKIKKVHLNFDHSF